MNMPSMSVVSLFLFVQALVVSVNADTLEGETLPPQSGRKNIELLSARQLAAKQEEYKELRQLIQLVSLREYPGEIPYDRIASLEDYANLNAVHLLERALTNEFIREEIKQEGDLRLCEIYIHLLGLMGTNNPSLQVEDMRTVLSEFRGRIKAASKLAVLEPTIQGAMDKMSSRPFRLREFDEFMEKYRASRTKPQQRADHFENTLRREVIGQEDAIRAAVNLHRHDLLVGRRDKPQVLYGVAERGKDPKRFVQAFVRALNPGVLRGNNLVEKLHLFSFPVLKGQGDRNAVLGSPTGYFGSDNNPELLKFLVEHSGGRYYWEKVTDDTGKSTGEKGKTTFKIAQNEKWVGYNLPGTQGAETAVIHLANFHVWSRGHKDGVIKRALEEGYFQVMNPNGGLDAIYVPVNYVISTPEGLGLITSRESDGTRSGPPMGYAQSKRLFDRVHNDKDLIRQEILGAYGHSGGDADSQRGTSQDLLDQVDNESLFMWSPLSPEQVREAAVRAADDFGREVLRGQGVLGAVKIEFTPEFLDLLQIYDHLDEDSDLAIEGKLSALLKSPLVEAVFAENFPREPLKEISVGVKDNADQTKSLVLKLTPVSGATQEFIQPISYTEKDRPAEPMSDARVREIWNWREEIGAETFGMDEALDRMIEAVINTENNFKADFESRAQVIFFFGRSSTGKSRIIEAVGSRVNESAEIPVFDFSRILDLNDFKREIWGDRDKDGHPIRSEFIKAFERYGGHFMCEMAEISNAPPVVHKFMYQLLRDKRVTFGDGVTRSMKGVMLGFSANAGEKAVDVVPADVPLPVRMDAWAKIHKQYRRNPTALRGLVEPFIPSAFLSRINFDNMNFNLPHTYRTLRELAQLRVGEALRRIRDTHQRRGYDLVFASEKEYSRFIDTMIDEGFVIEDQGASIEGYIANVEAKISSRLIAALVPRGARVVLHERSRTDNHDADNPGVVTYDAWVDGFEKPIEISLRRLHVEKPIPRDEAHHAGVSAHEVAHVLVERALFGDLILQDSASTLPGVARIGAKYIYFAGLASSTQNKDIQITREYTVRMMAMLLAGGEAERLITRGREHDAGKNNDMERVAELAETAVIRYGLAEAWGIHAVSKEDISKLPPELNAKFQKIKRELVEEAQKLARVTLEINFDTVFVPLYLALTEEGKLDKKFLDEYFKEHPVVAPEKISRWEKLKRHLRVQARHWAEPKKKNPLNFELLESLPKPKKYANVHAMAEAKKSKQYAQVPLPKDIPLGTNAAFQRNCAMELAF